MSNYPNALDDDTTLPVVNDNIDQIGGDAINALRDAVMQIELALGLNISGSLPSLAARLGVFINPDGTPNASVLTSLGLVTLPITNNQIADNASIPESKLLLDYRTQDLFNYIRDLSKDVNLALGWISVTGVKLEPHLLGAIYRHDLLQIDVSGNPVQFLNNVFRAQRDNTSAYSVVSDMNNELLAHQWADGSPFGVIQNIITNNGSSYPSNYGHTASGIFLNTSRFAVIPQTAEDVQAFADFIDNASILTLGTRIQNLYHNGISRNSRSSSLTADGYGQPLVPITPAIAFLRGNGNNSIPIDDIAIGEDIIQFLPSAAAQNNNSFDEQFALVRPGDIVRVSYAADGYNVEVPFVISEKKYVQGGGNKIYIVRIAGKNVAYAPHATARIDRDLYNNNKHGVLAVAGVNSPTTVLPSLIVGAPRGAQALGVGFSADEFNETHYLLYLALFTTGNPLDGYQILPAIDVTGNQGITPGSYTLKSIVDATNLAFRQPGFNYRFIAFEHEGEFGIMLADSINNASFSIISGVVGGGGAYNQAATQLSFPNNVVDVFPVTGGQAPDPLGLGPFGAGIASPPFQTTYGSAEAASLFPTILLPPLKRNNYYVNGTERELLNLDIGQVLDTYGDGYWVATIDGYVNNAGPPGHTTVTYNITLDLSASKLKAGKTIVVQPIGANQGGVNYGRFIIQSVTFSCCPPIQTQITVYDAIHATGVSPSIIAPVGTKVAIYLSSSSVSFNAETATDFSAISAALKRHFEIYVDGDGNTFTHERGRISINGDIAVNGVTLRNSLTSLGKMDIVSISPKLRGYQFGSVNKITLQFANFDQITGIYTGNLASYDGIVFSRQGPVTSGKVGEVTRFYDETNVDYIDVIFGLPNAISTFSNQWIDFQLFPTLALDEEVMIIASCQEQSDTNTVSHIIDLRQFGNTSEEELTTSALNFISLPDRLMHFNGVIRGFDGYVEGAYVNGSMLALKGGLVLTNGNILALNDERFVIPPLQEIYTGVPYPINYALCANSDGELVTIVLTDFDSILGTPNAPSRIVTVKNAVTANSYQVDSNTFSYILNNRKDLTILYIVSATVTGAGSSAATTISTRDVRRFINDTDASIPAVLTSDNSQGNFKTLAAALNWLKFNSAFQNSLLVKGAFTLSNDPGLNFPLTISGNGSTASLIFNGAMNMSNVTFDHVTVTFNAPLTATNVRFNECTVNFNAVATLNNVVIDPSIVNVNATVANTGMADFRDSTINVSIAQGFAIGSGLDFRDCVFNYTYNPVGGAPTYSTTDLVNAGSGLMYNNVTTSLIGFTVKDCVFNNTFADHFPFISLQLGGTMIASFPGAIVQDVEISGNEFNSQAASYNDIRAVISITSTILTPPTLGAYPAFPKLVDVIIANNECNYDQIILLSTVRTATQPITGSMLVCSNVKIRDNVCGVIGYMTASDMVSAGNNSEPANLGTIRDKTDQLMIEDNTCKLITNLDSVGQYIAFKATETTNFDWVQVSTGACAIDNNTCNWILVGCAGYRAGISYPTINAQGITISRNRLTVYNPNFLNFYKDVNNSGITPPSMGILLRQDNFQQVDFSASQSAINNNILENRTWLESVGVAFASYEYTTAIKCENTANIYGNVIGNVVNNAANPMVLLGGTSGGGPIIRFNNNILNRQGGVISAYVAAMNSNAINDVVITHNTFDSPTIDGSNINVGLNIPTAWTFHSNINQTAFTSISGIDYAVYPTFGSGLAANFDTPNGARPADALYKDTTNGYYIGRFSPASGFGLIESPAASYAIATDYTSVPAAGPRNFSFTIPLDYSLPQGVKIVSVTMGVWINLNTASLDITTVQGGTASANSNNQFTMSLLSFNPTSSSNNPTFGVADVKSNINLGGATQLDLSNSNILKSSFYVAAAAGGSAVTIANLQNSTQYMQITSSQISPLQSAFTVDSKHRIALTFDLNYLRTGGTTAFHWVQWFISPAVIQYRW